MPKRMSESPTTTISGTVSQRDMTGWYALLQAAAHENDAMQTQRVPVKSKASMKMVLKKRKTSPSTPASKKRRISSDDSNIAKGQQGTTRTKEEKIKASQAQQKLRDKEKSKLSKLKAGIHALLKSDITGSSLGRLTKLELYIAAIGLVEKKSKANIVTSILREREKKHKRNDGSFAAEHVELKTSDRFKRLRFVEKNYFMTLKERILKLQYGKKASRVRMNKYMVLDLVVEFIEGEARRAQN